MRDKVSLLDPSASVVRDQGREKYATFTGALLMQTHKVVLVKHQKL